MADQSIEEILSALKSHDGDSGVDTLMTELNNYPRSVPKTRVMPKQDEALDKILAELGETKTTSNQKQQIENDQSQTVTTKDNTLPEELVKIGNDIKKQKTDRAREWLEQLDPLSIEGLWFKEFAKHYPSDLDAALDFLQ